MRLVYPPVDSAQKPSIETLGRRLRAVRQARGLTLREAADRSGLSRSSISLVENGESAIAFSRLLRLADVYGVLITELLIDEQGTDAEVVRSHEAQPWPNPSEGVSLDLLTSPSWSMQPFRIRLAAGARLENLSHVNEEFLHCIEGSITMVVDGENIDLLPGDTLYIPGSAEHAYVNTSDAPAVLVGATSRPGGPDRASGLSAGVG